MAAYPSSCAPELCGVSRAILDAPYVIAEISSCSVSDTTSEAQQQMWSAVHRVDRDIFEEGDTNMLVEAWHHVLKGKFLDGKRNRRLDTLVCILHDDVIRHYKLRYHRQLHGFEGPDLEAQERIQVAERAREIAREDVKVRVATLPTHTCAREADLSRLAHPGHPLHSTITVHRRSRVRRRHRGRHLLVLCAPPYLVLQAHRRGRHPLP